MKSLMHSRAGRAPSSETLTPSSHKQRQPRFPKENVDPNAVPPESSPFQSPPVSGKSPAVRTRSPLPPRPPPSSNRLKRKLGSETLPENGDTAFSPCDSGVQVMVRVRPLNKEEDGVQIVQKISPNSISILDHTFTFDSVADASSSQHDIFQLVGIPLVENCLAGFNSSIFAYGQTGSGKTYTMWGPPNSLMEDCLLNPERGLTPLVFEQLFSRINEEQSNNSDKQLNFQCRCSFLEIYNEQITDLLDPAQRNLQIREDVRTGVYVEGLKEEYICTMNDLLHLLIMGLANRRTGATSINADSSRSHCVFTCILESRYKNMDDGLISLRTSRINLVDLAGSERQKATGAAGERLKEAGSINRSLSQLGNLINILAEVTQSGRNRHIPYRDSKLTFLLQDSLGGNAKLAMICAISPSKSCKSENFSTLRFAQRAKAVKNKAIVNETIEDDVNVLREQIRQLKDELLRMKSNDMLAESNGWNVRRSLSLLRLSLCRPRTLPVEDDSDEEMEIVKEGIESLCAEAHSPSLDENKSSVNEEPTLSESFKEQRPCYSDDKTVLTDICMKKAPEICSEMHLSSTNGNTSNVNEEPTHSESSKEQKPCYSDKENALGDICLKKVPDFGFECDQDSAFRHSSEKICKIEQRAAASLRTESQCGEIVEIAAGLAFPIPGMSENINTEVDVSKMIPAKRKLLDGGPTEITKRISTDSTDPAATMFPDQSHNSTSASSLGIVICKTSPIQSLTLGVSPKLENYSRKSLRTSKSATASQRNVTANEEPDSGGVNISCSDFLNKSNTYISSSQSRKKSLRTTENLATSLSQGLRIITDHHHSSSMTNASFRFPLRPANMNLLIPMKKADVGTQTLPQESILAEDSSVFICSYCKSKAQPLENNDNIEEPELQLVPIDGSDSLSNPQPSEGCKKLIPKAVEKVLAGAIRREMALEDQCAKKAAEIMHLNRLIQQYKHERECREIIEQAHENKISRLESLMDGIMPTEEFMEKEFLSLKNEHMILKEKYENHPEILRLNIELKMLQNELDGYRNFFDRGERDVLVEEIEDLRCHLRYIDSSSMSTWNKCPLLQMTHSTKPISDPLSKISEITDESSDEKFDRERRDWTEKERKWIFLYEELRTKLDVSQSLTEKLKVELESEKKCTQELKEALQTALQVHTRTLEHYADLEEKHIALLGRHRKLREAISNMKKVSRLGVKGESNFIQSLATQVEALRYERKRERQYWWDEKMALKTQLMDTAEALQAAGELLIRLKEAEEVAAIAQERALVAENKTEKAYQEIEVTKKKYDEEIVTLNKLLAESRSPKKGQIDEFSAGTETHSWFYDYDQCNI